MIDLAILDAIADLMQAVGLVAKAEYVRDAERELTTLRAIVQEVAESEPRRWGSRGGECVFCMKEDHEPDCIVSRAREAMR